MLWCCTNHLKYDEVQEEDDLKRLPPQKKIRPLLCDLEEQFSKHADDDGCLSKVELANIWKECAKTKFGKLSEDETRVIEDSVNVYYNYIDMDNSGTITYEEFVTCMMGATDEREALKDFRKQLRVKMKEDPKTVQKLVDKFKEWDKNGDGLVTPAELEQHLSWLYEVATENGRIKTPYQAEIAESKAMFDEIFKTADIDGDGNVDLWEVMAYGLGRRKSPVELLLYDISGGAANKLGVALVGKKMEAVHSGLLVFDSEYWYGGRVFRSEPPCSAQFGQPLAKPWGVQLGKSEQFPNLPCIHLGYTFVTHEEFISWLNESGTLAKYTGIEKYDLLTHSCNHFANEVCTFLTGQGLPDKVFELQKTFLSKSLKSIMPFINKHLGGFADATKDLDENLMAVDMIAINEQNADQLAQAVLGAGDVVLAENIDGIEGSFPATILSEKDGMCEIKYYCVETQAVTTKTNVPKAKLKRTKTT